ncbi:MAG: DUF4238 domain-containing protein [Pyrinomonadaceae bacterium]|nr:DUF4238 domain-containing protein [Pyrinomonadaceae bacterium]
MAGKRQHIIPKFLQKGFASRIDDKDVFVWAFRKDTDPFEANTKNIFVENYFYGKEGEEIYADGIITDLEELEFSPLMDNLRNAEGNVNKFSSQIASFISNLLIRTKFLRETFIDSSKYVVDGLSKHLSDEENIQTLMSNPTLIDRELKNVLNSQEVTNALNNLGLENSEALKGLLPNIVKLMLPEIVESEKGNIANFFKEFFEQTTKIIPEGIKRGQINSIIKSPNPEWIVEFCERLEWFIVTVNQSLILGDTVCIFEVINEVRKFKPIIEKNDNISTIFLPISSNRLLIGTHENILDKINTEELNSIIAKCSFQQFICSESTQENLNHKNSIGLWSGIMSQEEMERLRNEMLDDLNNVS